MTESERTPLLRGISTDSDPAFSLQTWKTKFACATVLLTEMLERIAFYGLTCNLVMFLNLKPLGWASTEALDALYFFMGLSYISALFGGFVADAGLNRFRTIIVFLLVYVGGYVFFPLLVPPPLANNAYQGKPTLCGHNGDSNKCIYAVYGGLSIVALGVGAVKANIAPFGADQVKHQSPHIHRMFFNWFYWCINIGAFLAVGLLGFAQQEWSFFWGYVIPNICVLLALVVFLTGSSVYVKKPASGSVLTNVWKILCESCRISWRKRRHPVMLSSNVVDSLASNQPASPGCIDYAKVRYGGSFQDSMVEDVKTLGKIFAVFLSLIPYWLVYFQMESTYVVQGLHMKLDFSNSSDTDDGGKHSVTIAVAWLSLFDVVFLIVLLPLLDLVIYPFLDRRGYSLSVRARIITGMVFAVLSVIVAGVVETFRLSSIWKNNTMDTYNQTVHVGNETTTYYASHMSVMWQIPQYTLIGVSEAFASVAGLELAYMYAPRSMKAIIMGLFWFTQGLASLLGIGSLLVFKGTWFFTWDRGDINCRLHCYKNSTDHTHSNTVCYPDSPNNNHGKEMHFVGKKTCHLDYYFFFLAALQLVGIALFMWISWALNIGGKSRKANPPRVSQNIPRQSSQTEVRLEGTTGNVQPGGTAALGQGIVANGDMSNIQKRVVTRDTSADSP